jgi:flagellar basal-body rod modification protein FlgD
MDINTVSSSAATSSAVATADNGSGAKISSDFETFLKMLTVQMQNQDPLNPVDSSDYATQLATFSGVEQQVQTNDLLRSLAGQMGTGLDNQPVVWAGVRADGRQMPDGHYRFETVSSALNEVVATNTAEVYATVSEVQIKDGINTLVLSGGRTVAASDVTAVRDAALS